MADVNLSQVTDLLVEDVEPSVNDQLEYETLGFAMFKKNVGVSHLKNHNYSLPVRTGRTSGVFGVTETNNSVVHGAPSYDEAVLAAKTLTNAFKITHQALAVESDGSVTPLFDQVMSDVAKDYMHILNRQFFGNGTGVIGTANATEGVATATFVFAPSLNNDLDYAERVAVGSYVKIGSNNGVRVSAIPAKNTLTLASTQTWAAGDSVVIVNTSGATTNASVEINGMGSIIGTGSFQSIDGTSLPFWQAYRKNHSAAALTTEATLNEAFVRQSKFGDTKFIICNVGLFSDYAGLLTSQKKTANATDPLGGGWSGLEFMGGKADIILDFDAPDDRFIGVAPDAGTMVELEPFHWLKEGGLAIHRLDGTLNYEVIGVQIMDIGCSRRNAFWEVYNIDRTP